MLKIALQRAVILYLCWQFLGVYPIYAGEQQVPERIHFKRLVESEDRHRFSYISSLTSGPQGFLWLGTGHGLLRYDGQYTTLFETQPNDPHSLTGNYIRGLAFDHDGFLWVATEYGLNRYDPVQDRFTQYLTESSPPSINNNFVKAVIVTRDNRVYVGTADGIDIFSADRSEIQHLSHHANEPNSLSHNNVIALLESRTGEIWIGTEGGGVNVYDPSSGIIKQHRASASTNSLLDNHVTALCEDNNGAIWIGTQGKGVSRYSNGVFKNYSVGNKPGELPDGTIYQIMEDYTGLVWILTDRAGALIYDADTDAFVSFQHDPFNPATLQGNTAKAITEDKDNNIWVATFPIGLNYFDRSNAALNFLYRIENHVPTLSHSTILDVQRGSDGRLWLGTEIGLNILDEQTGEIVAHTKKNTQGQLAADAVLTIKEDSDGSIWLGTWGGGLTRFYPKTGKFKHYQSGSHGPGRIKSPFIWDIFLDADNTLWVGTETDGLNRYDRATDSFVSYTHRSGDATSISYDYVWDIIDDDDGYLWVATQFGLNRFNKTTQRFKSWLPDTRSPGAITASRIQDLLFDSNGYLWLATQGGGINRFDHKTGTFIHITREQGLPSDAVSLLVEDESGYIWAGTAAGLVQIDSSTFEIQNVLTEHNGLHNHEFIRNASLKETNGTLYFGSANGLVYFNPKQLQRTRKQPQAKLTDLKVFNNHVEIGVPGSLLQRHISETQTLALSVAESVITLDFTAINFNKHHENRFSYQLVNFDKQWNHIKRGNSATYTNLRPGNYTFKLTTRDHLNKLSDDLVALEIQVATPWWWSWYAIVFYGLAAVALVAILVRLYLLNFTAKQLNVLVAQRTTELERANAAKTDFLANMSHELRTPLNSIIGFSKRLQKKCCEHQDPQQFRALDAIYRNGIHLLHLINDILDVSKIEAGKMKLEILPCNVQLMIEQLIDDSRPKAEEKGLSIIPPEHYPVTQIPADPVRINQIVSNLLSNAIKYTHEGEIRVTVETRHLEGKHYCRISVIDTGIGIKKEDQARLFSRFEQFDAKTKHQRGFGTGLGLALVHNLTLAHQGFVEFSSEYQKGSTFRVNLPMMITPIRDLGL